MACGSCGARRGHLDGCPVVDAVPIDSQVYAWKQRKAKNEAEGKTKCPPHDFYKIASGRDSRRDGGRKWRTDQCTKCRKTHTYYV